MRSWPIRSCGKMYWGSESYRVKIVLNQSFSVPLIAWMIFFMYRTPTSHVQTKAREIIMWQYAAPPHENFTPTAVLTESPPLLETVAGREYHCHSDCHCHIGGNPIFTKRVLARPGEPGCMAYPAAVACAFAHQN